MTSLNQLQQFSKFILFLIISLQFSTLALAQDVPETECPYFNVFGSDTTGLAFTLESTSVEAEISGVISNVRLTQTYTNAGDSTVNASYVFPMSSKAAVYSMQMQVNERTIDAIIKRKDEAQEIFDNATNDGLTATLLEQERPNVFQMSLANIQPGDTIRVHMNYTELLVPEGGSYQFVFPNVVGPRYTAGGEPWVAKSKRDSSTVANSLLEIDLKIKAGTYVSATCKSHTVDFDNVGINTECRLSTNPGPDFIVDYTFAREDLESSLLLHEDVDENFFLSIIHPPKPDINYPSPPREYIFIIDVSGSMRGTPLDISKELIKNLLSDLDNTDKFNIIFFAGGSTVMSPNSIAATTENIDMAVEMLENTIAGGSTQLLPALEQALAMTGSEEFSRTFVIATDGYVTVEKPAFELIRNNLNEANFFSFGIGTSVNRYIIEGIAYVGEGEPFIVTDFLDADEISDRFKKYIERPALTNITAQFEGIDVYDVEPLTIPDVFAERPVIIYGKYNKPAQGRIKLNGEYGNTSIESILPFQDANPQNEALKYLWARKKIRLMSDYGIASNENDTISIEEEITQLGLKYSLVTQFTSFVAVDSSAITTVDTTPVDGNGGGSGGGGGVVETEEIDKTLTQEVSYFTILGTVVRDNNLKLEFKEDWDLSQSNLRIRISDMNGNYLAEQTLDIIHLKETINIDVNDLPSGLYSVSLYSDNKMLETQKFVVVH